LYELDKLLNYKLLMSDYSVITIYISIIV